MTAENRYKKNKFISFNLTSSKKIESVKIMNRIFPEESKDGMAMLSLWLRCRKVHEEQQRDRNKQL